MERNKKTLSLVCILGLVTLSLSACEGLEYGSYARSNVPPMYESEEEEEEEEIDDTIHVSSVSFKNAKDHYLLLKGETITLNAEVLPVDALDQRLLWSIEPTTGYEEEDFDDEQDNDDGDNNDDGDPNDVDPDGSGNDNNNNDEPTPESIMPYDSNDADGNGGNDGDDGDDSDTGNTGSSGDQGSDPDTGGESGESGDDGDQGGDPENPDDTEGGDDDDEEPEPEPEPEPDYVLNNGSVELEVYDKEATITALRAGLSTITVTSIDGELSASTEINVAAEEETYTDYIVNFDLAEGVEVPSYGELELAVSGIDNYFTLAYDEESGFYSADIGVEAVGERFTYSIYLNYTSYYRELDNCPQYTTELEVETLYGGMVVDETYTENDVLDTITSIPTLPSPIGTYDEINIELTIYSDDTCHTPTEIPDTIDAYIEWSNDNWTTRHEAYVGGEGLLVKVPGTIATYTYTFSEEAFISSQGTIEYEIYYEVAPIEDEEEEEEEVEKGDEEEPEEEKLDYEDYDLRYLEDPSNLDDPSNPEGSGGDNPDDEQGSEEEEIEKVEISRSFYAGTGSFQVPYFYDKAITVSFCDYDRGANAEDFFFSTEFYILFVDTSGYELESLVTRNDVSSEYEPNIYPVMSNNKGFIDVDVVYGDTCMAYSGAFVSPYEDCPYDGYGCIYLTGSAKHKVGETDTFTMVFDSSDIPNIVSFSTGEIEVPEKEGEETDLVYICLVDFSDGTLCGGVWIEVDDYSSLFTAIEIEDEDEYMEGSGSSDGGGN